jgi:UDPglucose 6-dehydrogenase
MSAPSTIGYAGLSHLGIVSSLASAARGHSVLAFDARPGLAENLAARHFPLSEPRLEETYQANRERIRYTGDETALAQCDPVFITLDVATDDENKSDLAPLNSLIDRVEANCLPGTTLVLMSQVPPGFCRALANRFGSKFIFYYQVETLIFGNAVDRAINPERFIVGCTEPKSAFPVAYRAHLDSFQCPLVPMRYESAELCKIAINCFLVSSVSTTNVLAEICENVGADWREIAPALRLDKRIGPHAYLTPGLGIAGGNLERDLVTIQRLSAAHNTDSRVVAAWRQNSDYRKDWVGRLLSKPGFLPRGADTRIAVWGIAYKADTHSIKNSPSVALLQQLGDRHVKAYDPAARLPEGMRPWVETRGSALDAAAGADILLIVTPWKEFSAVPVENLKSSMRGKQIVDPYGVLDADLCRRNGFDYYRLGIG